jgi:hypothetical protein
MEGRMAHIIIFNLCQKIQALCGSVNTHKCGVFGQDRISNYDTNASSIDIARFNNASVEDLWFACSGNDLVISRIGSTDKVNVSNWYSGASYQLDKIEVDSAALLNSQVNQLVNAMAAFAPPVGAGSVLSQGHLRKYKIFVKMNFSPAGIISNGTAWLFRYRKSHEKTR